MQSTWPAGHLITRFDEGQRARSRSLIESPDNRRFSPYATLLSAAAGGRERYLQAEAVRLRGMAGCGLERLPSARTPSYRMCYDGSGRLAARLMRTFTSPRFELKLRDILFYQEIDKLFQLFLVHEVFGSSLPSSLACCGERGFLHEVKA